MEQEDKKGLTRRALIKAAGIGTLAASVAPGLILPGVTPAAEKN